MTSGLTTSRGMYFSAVLLAHGYAAAEAEPRLLGAAVERREAVHHPLKGSIEYVNQAWEKRLSLPARNRSARPSFHCRNTLRAQRAGAQGRLSAE
ncbi:MAG: hypothetical protein R3F27_12425 [Gammaproteobacteria bacterium]